MTILGETDYDICKAQYCISMQKIASALGVYYSEECDCIALEYAILSAINALQMENVVYGRTFEGERFEIAQEE